jgi:hypothetical protein
MARGLSLLRFPRRHDPLRGRQNSGGRARASAPSWRESSSAWTPLPLCWPSTRTSTRSWLASLGERIQPGRKPDEEEEAPALAELVARARPGTESPACRGDGDGRRPAEPGRPPRRRRLDGGSRRLFRDRRVVPAVRQPGRGAGRPGDVQGQRGPGVPLAVTSTRRILDGKLLLVNAAVDRSALDRFAGAKPGGRKEASPSPL